MILNIIICVFNEEKTIKTVLDNVLKVSLPNRIKKKIIVIDNNSTDNTKKILEKYNNKIIKIIYNKKNIGKGGSIIKSLNYCEGDLVVFQDADLEYEPKNYILLINEMIKKNNHAVFGSRVIEGENYHVYNLNRLDTN